MSAYIIRRLLLIIPTLFILSVLVFLSVRFIPGDAIDAMLGKTELMAAEVDREALEHMLGLDVPAHVQYARWIGGILLDGTLGPSLIGNREPVEARIIGRLPVTIELGVLAILIGLVIALPVGIYSADAPGYGRRLRGALGRHPRPRHAQLLAGNHGRALPVPLVGVVAADGVCSALREDPLGNLGVLILPSVILGTALAAATMRMTRTMMLEVLRQDYIRTAWSKGLQGAGGRHAARRQECPDSGGDPDRPSVADPDRWLGHHGEHIQPAGVRPSHADCA